jgi:DeoR family ulaG and ulaABCDEF operon transcriptional repressor
VHQTLRHRVIEDVLAERELVTVDELVARLGASPATVRRDLSALAQAGRLRRVRGGVELLPIQPVRGLRTPSFERTRRENLAQKRAIAARAAALCRPGESIIVNGGTTTFCLGERIADMALHVLTNSFALAEYLAGRGDCRVLLPGGEIYREQNLVLSPYEHDTMLDHFYASKMFTGAQAIRAQGLIEGDPILIKAEQKLIKRAEQLIVLVDGSKFVPRGSLILCPLAEIDLVVTDSGAPPEAIDLLRDAGVAVEVVEVVDSRRELSPA